MCSSCSLPVFSVNIHWAPTRSSPCRGGVSTLPCGPSAGRWGSQGLVGPGLQRPGNTAPSHRSGRLAPNLPAPLSAPLPGRPPASSAPALPSLSPVAAPTLFPTVTASSCPAQRTHPPATAPAPAPPGARPTRRPRRQNSRGRRRRQPSAGERGRSPESPEDHAPSPGHERDGGARGERERRCGTRSCRAPEGSARLPGLRRGGRASFRGCRFPPEAASIPRGNWVPGPPHRLPRAVTPFDAAGVPSSRGSPTAGHAPAAPRWLLRSHSPVFRGGMHTHVLGPHFRGKSFV